MERNSSHRCANPASRLWHKLTDFGKRQIHAHTRVFCLCVFLQLKFATTCSLQIRGYLLLGANRDTVELLHQSSFIQTKKLL